jgi:hypothetical protein
MSRQRSRSRSTTVLILAQSPRFPCPAVGASAIQRRSTGFASIFFDAFLNARLDDTITVEFSLLCASAYYLAGNVGSTTVIVRHMDPPGLDLAGRLGRLVHAILANDFRPIHGEHAHAAFTLAVLHALGGYMRFENDMAAVLDACDKARAAFYENGSPRELLYSDLVAAICARKLRNASRTLLPAASDLDPGLLWVLGSVEGSLRLADRALADAKSAAHAPTMVNVLRLAALLGLFRCNPEAVVTYSQALADIVSRYDLHAHWAGYAVFFQGWAKWSDGAEESRLAEMRRGLAIFRELRSWFLPSLEAALAEAEARAGETDAGLRRLDDALAELEATEAVATKRRYTASAPRSC